MYAGHVALALGAKGLRDTIPLWLLVFATQLPDWADAGFCIAGIRTAVAGMYTHSLPAVAVLAAVASLFWFAASRDGIGASVVGWAVVSHMFCDYVTGIKPTWPGGPLVGLGLYRIPVADFAIETILILACWMLYRTSLSEERRGSLPVNLIPVALVLFQLAADITFSIAPPLRKC